MSMEDDVLLYRREFHILWNAGKPEIKVDETVVVCSVTIDDGHMTIIRIFESKSDDDIRSEDKLLEWLPHDPYVCDSARIEIEIITSHSPIFSFSKTFSELKFSLEEQGKDVHIDFKIVRMYNVCRGEEEAEDNKNGLREMAEAKIHLSSVTGQDWQYLRQILRHRQGIKLREKTCRKVRKSLKTILKMPQDVETNTESDAEFSRKESSIFETPSQTEYSTSSEEDN